MGNNETAPKFDSSCVYDLIERFWPGRSIFFVLHRRPNKKERYFQISKQNGKVVIEGNDNVSLGYGIHFYFRSFMNNSVSWCCNNLSSVETELVLPESSIKKSCTFPLGYYLNYCTHSYTMAFWDWPRWEREIDWMVLHGVNLVLAMTGQQAVWRNTMLRMGFSQEDIRTFIPGPAFEAWWLMQNLEGWGGSVSDEFIEERVALQQRILARIREFEIKPILQGFFGMVPRSTSRLFPKARLIDSGKWQGFDRPLILDPSDPLFDTFSNAFYEEQWKLYGDCEFFAGDPFHEMGVGKGDFKSMQEMNFRKAGEKIYSAMKGFCDRKNAKKGKVTWVLQAWEGGNQPNSDLLKGLKQGETLVLDLFSDSLPQWGGVDGLWTRGKNSYEGHDWLWCVLDNFGGSHSILGRTQSILSDLPKALSHPLGRTTLKGVGATMEAIERNCFVFDLLFDIAWDLEGLKIDEWMKMFVRSRYGSADEKALEAWSLIRRGLLCEETDKMSAFNIIQLRPKLGVNLALTPREKDRLGMILRAWKNMMEMSHKFNENLPFNYDLVDLTRHIFIEYMSLLYFSLEKALKSKDLASFETLSSEFLEGFETLDELLGTHEAFLLGKWLRDAFSLGKTEEEGRRFVMGAKQQLTVWGPSDNPLSDYAAKDFNGLVLKFYKLRWTWFLNKIKENWEKFDFKDFKIRSNEFFDFEKKWVETEHDIGEFMAEPIGNPIEKCNQIFLMIYDKMLAFSMNKD